MFKTNNTNTLKAVNSSSYTCKIIIQNTYNTFFFENINNQS